MKLKNLLFLLGTLPFLGSCDDIKEDDRYIETGPVEVGRKVLLEEFTGQRCPNCPAGHEIIENLEEQYGDNLIAVSIHAGNLAVKAPLGLRQEEGDIYNNYWNISSWPAGVVDRNSGVLDRNKWASAVRDDIKKTTELQISLEAQLNEEGSEIEIFTTMVTSRPLQGSLQLWVVENNIVAYQIDGKETIMDYVHNNVFRQCVNGQWGEEIPLESNVVKYVSNTVPVDEFWRVENVGIVGFYYNSTGVIQVERCAVSGVSSPETPEE